LYVFGADHHGYVTRMKAACEALGHDPQRLEFLLIQFAILYRSGERVQMSTRSGSFVTLRIWILIWIWPNPVPMRIRFTTFSTRMPVFAV